MTKAIKRVLLFSQPQNQVWRAITDRATLAEWMFPNDFEPRVGHQFTFRVPGNPKVNFDGMIVNCEVLECEPPSRLAFSWVAGGLADSRVSFRLEPHGEGTGIFFEHSGFDVTVPFGEQAFQGAEFGWAKMLKQLAEVVAGLSALESSHANRFRNITLFNTTIIRDNIRSKGMKRSILRWIHILFGLTIIGYVYGPPEEVLQYRDNFRFVFVPVIVLTGLWMWKGHVVRQYLLAGSASEG